MWSDPEHPQWSVVIPQVTTDKKHVVIDLYGSESVKSTLLVADLPEKSWSKDNVPKWTVVGSHWDGTYRCQPPSSLSLS